MNIQLITVVFVALILIAAVASVFPNPKVQMYGKISLISLAAIFLLILIFFRKKPIGTDTKAQQFTDQLTEVKNNISEVTTVAKLKTQFANEQQDEKLAVLNEVTKISDKDVRRKKLAEIAG
jgi:hypothetical protein